jgi:hypothetical protein
MRIMTEEEWNNSRGITKRIRTDLPGYVASMQKQIDELNKTIIIAQKSLDADQPDMKYVPERRPQPHGGVSLLRLDRRLVRVLLGGWLIASEYQQGTIRLLMIRPKTPPRSSVQVPGRPAGLAGRRPHRQHA